MYRLCRALARFILWIAFGLEVKGAENIPAEGGGVIAANHVSLIDPVAVGVAVKRPIHFMAKKELFRNWFSRWFFHSIKAFPVNRGRPDRNAIRVGLTLLEKDCLVGIFPEGTRVKNNHRTQTIHSGAAFFYLKSRRPIIPVVVRGTDSLCFRKRISVIVGQPIYPKEGKNLGKEELINVNNMIVQQFTSLGRQEFN